MVKKHFSISIDSDIVPVIDLCAKIGNRSRSAEIEYTLKKHYKNFTVNEGEQHENQSNS